MMHLFRKQTLLVLSAMLVFLIVGCGDDNGPTSSDDPSSHETWLVQADGSGDAPNIQAAIELAAFGDSVLLGDGTYTGTGNRDIDFEGKAIILSSQSGNPSMCIIDCQGSAGDPHRGFYFHSNETADAVLEGLTVTNGYESTGGGMFIQESSPTVTNCYFTNNEATDGGGAGIILGSNSTLTGCIFSDNSASNSGGGMNTNTASPTLINCTFIGNSTGILGGGLRTQLSDVVLVGCTFYGNTAAAGSGVAGRNGSNLTLEKCIIAFNLQGDAVNCSAHDLPSSASLSCCDLYENEGGDWVGCVAEQSGTDGNISEDPLFCDAMASDLRLDAASPCLNAEGCGQMGAWGEGCGRMPNPH